MARLATEIHDAVQTALTQVKPGSPEAEAAADALLAKSKAWLSHAHSERPNTKWNKKHDRHQTELDAGALQVLDRYIESQEIVTAAAAGLNEREYLIWHYIDQEGVSQTRLAAVLGVSRRTVSRVVLKAREGLKWLVDKSAKRAFREDSHRFAYFPPSYRPALPEGVEEAREVIEIDVEVTTHIMPDALNFVEIHRNGNPITDDLGKTAGVPVCKLKNRHKVNHERRMRNILRKTKAMQQKN